jgi:drug/metabolite transporter (DMT)-like permease
MMATTAQTAPHSMNWLFFALLTVASWGVYGILLHKGSVGMKAPGSTEAPDVLRYKAFLFVGIAYFLVAILAPAALLLMKGASWSFPAKGLWLSLIAGIVGAVGAFGVLLAFGAGGLPTEVMSIIFAGAPVVNSLVLVFFVDKTYNQVDWRFALGIILAAAGGVLVTLYRPPAPAHAKAKPTPIIEPVKES